MTNPSRIFGIAKRASRDVILGVAALTERVK